ncbi:MAG TPA: hypothetical protein VJT81_16050 [Burkholderiales bacterium]|nr:hypothetical protein [Burkholderiales bacterium]
MDRALVGEGWKLSLLEGWSDKREVAEHLLVPPDGGAVLSIRTTKINRSLTDKDLRYLARDLIEDGYEPEGVKLGEFEGLAFRYEEDNAYWRQWYLRNGLLWLQINYDCPESDQGMHDVAIDRILATLAVDADAS